MRIFKLLLLGTMLLPSPALSMPPNYWEREGGPKDQLKPWFRDIQKQIKKQADFQKVTKEIGDKKVFCSFELGKGGSAVNLRNVSKIGCETIGQAALEVVRKAGPFKTPPNNLPYKKRIVIEFLDSSNKDSVENPNVFLEPFNNWSFNRWE